MIVLLMQDRGLSLTGIGTASAAQGVVMLFLELPSGGVADAIGRKPALVVAGVLGLVTSGIVLASHSVLVLAVGYAIAGVFRALDSGPLQSWYIDALLARDGTADMERELAHSDVTICAAIGAGALLSGGLVRLGDLGGLDALATPLALGLIVQLVGLVAVVVLVDEPPRASLTADRPRVRAVVDDAIRTISTSRVLTALVAVELLWGFGMVAFEILFAPRLEEIEGDPEAAARIVGICVAAGWALSAAGAAVAPQLVARAGSRWAGVGGRLGQGIAVGAMAVTAGPAGLVAAYLVTYGFHGASGPVHYGVVHRAVESAHRTTVISANSLASQLGGAVGVVGLSALADTVSIRWAIAVAAVGLAAAAPLYLVRDRPGPVEPTPATVT